MKYGVSLFVFWLMSLTSHAAVQIGFKPQVTLSAQTLGDIIVIRGVDEQTQQRISTLPVPTRLHSGMVITRTRMTGWLSQLLSRPNLVIDWLGPVQTTVSDVPVKQSDTLAQVQSIQMKNSDDPVFVHAGHDVDILVNYGRIHLNVSGIAHQTGRFGEWVDVENRQNHQSFKARVIGEKTVEVVR